MKNGEPENLPKNADFGRLTFDEAEYQFYRKNGIFYLRRELRDGTGYAEISLERQKGPGGYVWKVESTETNFASLRPNYYTPAILSSELNRILNAFKE